MKIENYKSAMSEIQISESKFNELCEMIDSPDMVRENRPAKKKIKRISIPVLIAAIFVLTVGGTVFAAELSGNSILKLYFRGITEKYDLSNIPVIDNEDIYITETTYTADVTTVTDVSDKDAAEKESMRFVSAVRDKYNIFVMLEYEADESVLTDDIPEDAVFGFWEHCSSSGISQQIECDPFSGNKFSVAYHIGGIDPLPEDDLVIDMKNFGFYSDNSFITLSEEKFAVTVPISEITVQQSIKADNSVQVNGIEFEAELSPFGLLLSSDTDAYINDNGGLENYFSDKYLFSFNNFAFYMKDGSVFGDGESYDSVYGLIRSQTGWIDFENGKEYNSYGFTVPVDISEIERISFHGEKFFFNVSQDEY